MQLLEIFDHQQYHVWLLIIGVVERLLIIGAFMEFRNNLTARP